MKKVTILALIALMMSLLTMAIFRSPQINLGIFGKPKASVNNLNYIFVSQASRPFSFNPLHSDSASNAIVMNAIVGTLVKYGPTGQIEPYLAQSWKISKDERTWTFSLREGLFDESGAEITAKNYIESLNRQARLLSAFGSVLQFDRLVGWKEFLRDPSKPIEGLLASSENEIVFRFERKPEGLLSLLQSGYFGFFSPKNYTENGVWKNDEMIVASGPYKVELISSDKMKVVVRRRDSWFSLNLNAPESITFTYDHDIDLHKIEHDLPVIIQADIPDDFKDTNFKIVSSTPNFLVAAILSPFKKGPFKKQAARKLFAQILRRQNLESENPSKRAYVSDNFNYLDNPSEKFKEDPSLSMDTLEEKIKVIDIASFVSSKERTYAHDLIAKTSSSLNTASSFYRPKDLGDDWIERALSDREFDIRLVSVHVGGNVWNLNNQLMFCTKLGIRFPDPSGRICSLVKYYEDHEKSVDQEYIDNFYSILREDASVVPLFHVNTTWLYSRSIEIDHVSGVSETPRFDLLSIK